MNKKGIIIGVVVVALILLVGVFNSNSSQIDETKGEIKIGTTLPLSGSLAFAGEQYMKGLEFAVEQINEKGGIDGKKVTLIIENNEGNVESAVSNVQKLIALDNVDFIFSAFTHITNGVAGIIEQSNIPMLYASTLADIAESNDLFYRDYWDSISLGLILGNYLDTSVHNNIAYLGEINEACESFFDTVNDSISSTDKEFVITERFQPNPADLRSNLSKIKSTNPDAIVTCTWRNSDIFMKQLEELGMIDIKTFQYVAPFLPNGDTPEMRKLYEKNKAISTWYGFSQGSLNKKQMEFSEKFKNRYGVEPNSDATFFYDDMMFVKEVMEGCVIKDEIDSECFSKNMKNNPYEGIAGNLRFNDKGLSQRDGILMSVQDGEWVEIK